MAYIEIYLKMQNKALKSQLIEGKAIVKNGVSLTTYKDPNYTKRTFAALKKLGKNCEFKDNVIVELYEGQKMEEIADSIIATIKQLKQKYSLIMDVEYTRRKVK